MKKRRILALGVDIKNKFLVAEAGKLQFGPDVQDLSDASNYDLFRSKVRAAIKKVTPNVIAYDMHPGYFSSGLAKKLSSEISNCSLLAVQHHHAHIASVMYENGLKTPVIGVSFDGTGYGTDGNIWGGEFLIAKGADFKRAAHLKYQMLPGGDKVVSEPWRMVLSIMGEEGENLVKGPSKREKKLVLKMMQKGINSPLSSSAGRLFDAAAALLGICECASYEAEGPITLESLCKEELNESYSFDMIRTEGNLVIDPKKIFLGMAKDQKKGVSIEAIATKFHNSILEIITKTVKRISKQTGIKDAVLSGGVFQNTFLTEKCIKALILLGFRVFTNRETLVNDSNIAWGQYYVASSSALK